MSMRLVWMRGLATRTGKRAPKLRTPELDGRGGASAQSPRPLDEPSNTFEPEKLTLRSLVGRAKAKPILSGHRHGGLFLMALCVQLAAAVGEVAVTEDAGVIV